MKHIAMIQAGQVVNMALWDGEDNWNPGPDYLLIDVTNLRASDGQPVDIGATYDGVNFTNPTRDN